jgi:hypothetical protein
MVNLWSNTFNNGERKLKQPHFNGLFQAYNILQRFNYQLPVQLCIGIADKIYYGMFISQTVIYHIV